MTAALGQCPYTESDPLRVVELFAGIGAQRTALKNLGIPHDVVAIAEIDQNAIKAYQAIHGETRNLGDVSKIEHIPSCDLLTYSFPCIRGDQVVTTTEGMIAISLLKEGDMVLTHRGRYRKVTAHAMTGVQETCRICTPLGELVCTPFHRIYVRHKTLYGHGYGDFTTPCWKPADALMEGDYVGYPGPNDLGAELHGTFYKDGIRWVPVRDIQECSPAEVYDISVEEDESFVAEGMIVHNCQDLSIAGYQRGMSRDSGTRSALLWEVGRLLTDAADCGSLPSELVMENVDAIVNKRNLPNFEKWIQDLYELGYTSSYDILNAKNFGVPQNRKRCFMVSSLQRRKFVFPTGHPTEKRLHDVLESDVDEYYYLSDEKVAKYQEHKKRHDAQGHGLGWKPVNGESIAHPLTAVPSRHSQNFLVEQGEINGIQAEEPGIHLVGRIESKYDMYGRVYGTDGIAPSLRTFQGGGLVPKIKEDDSQ